MRRWTLPSRAERGRVILSGAWTTSTCYKPREIERSLSARPSWGFLPKLFRLQSNSPRRHDMLNDHPRFLHHDAIYHQLQYLLLHLEGRLLKRPTHTGTKCFNPFKQAHLI